MMLSTELAVPDAALVFPHVGPIQTREDSSAIDWSIVRHQRLNAVVIGPRAAADAALSRAFPNVQWRDAIWTATAGADRFGNKVALVCSAQDLTDGDQQQLLAWMDRHPAIQVVTLADRPLYPLVAAGSFLAALYYRLNIFYFAL